MAGVELAASENGIPSQFTAWEEDGQHKTALQTSYQALYEDGNFKAGLAACCCDSQ